jgi:V8-like Glu-specific endopeptidase
VPTKTAASTDVRTSLKGHTENLAIVKLFIQFESQNDDTAWAMATGWLIAADTVITAGHCAYDWSAGMKRAIKIKAYIGYYGKGSVSTDTSVQFKYGKQIVTTSGWLSAEGHRESDVSFIQLTDAFTGTLNLIKYQGTPVTGSQKLGVVGYPADKKDSNGERGAQMYEDFESVKWDLTTSFKNMLEYPISTYAGIFPSSSLTVALMLLQGILDPPFCKA